MHTLLDCLQEAGLSQRQLQWANNATGTPATQTDVIMLGQKKAFIKFGALSARTLFDAEANGLEALRGTHTLRVPETLQVGSDTHFSWIILEYLDLNPSGNYSLFGQQLAALHRTEADRYGYPDNNFIGLGKQANRWQDAWSEFWWQQRLWPQLETAINKGYSKPLTAFIKPLETRVRERLHTHRPTPSLLHGDLWAGNHGYETSGEPVIFDPAVYFGDRETDLAMMELFGGYEPAVYNHYSSHWPVPRSYLNRRPVYQLYHLLNHLNLFGSGWWGRCATMIETCIQEPFDRWRPTDQQWLV